MMPTFKRVLFIVLLLLGVLLATLTRSSTASHMGALSARVAPLFGMSYRLGQNVRSALSVLVDRRDLRQELSTVKSAYLKAQQKNQQLEVDNRSLRASLKIQNSGGVGIVASAPIIDDDPSSFYSRLYLGAGSAQGLEVGMAVTAPAGLVGVITEVTPRTAVVRTLLDPETQVGVRLAAKAGRGRAYGQPPDLIKIEFAPEVNVALGDRVISNSTQGLFPAGLTVGNVVKLEPIKRGALKRFAYIKPNVRFAILEEVQVLRSL